MTASPWYSQPQWLVLLFLAGWVVLCHVYALAGGWHRLAKTFRATAPAKGEAFRFASGAMGWPYFPVNYGACLFIALSDQGIHLTLARPFRFLSPALLIPWSSMASVTAQRSLLLRYTEIEIIGHWPRLILKGEVGRRALTLSAARTSSAVPAHS